MNNSITLLDGKYTFTINDQLQVVVLRYSGPWREFNVGDKAMWALVTHAIELEAENAKLKKELKQTDEDYVRYGWKNREKQVLEENEKLKSLYTWKRWEVE
jgi:hypothetical protein